jgi:hypothetical protein
MDKEEQIRTYYHTLFQVWGPQHWWPARTRFEVIVGAYLTQNTSWTNVERALRRLRSAGLLNLRAMREVSLTKLESQIRSWLFSAESPTAKDVRGLLGRPLRRFAHAHVCPADGKASPGTAGAKWGGARNRRRHPSLRGSAPGVCCGCVYSPDAWTPRHPARKCAV